MMLMVDFFNIHDLVSGYSGYFNDALLEKIQHNPMVKFVEALTPFSTQENLKWKKRQHGGYLESVTVI